MPQPDEQGHDVHHPSSTSSPPFKASDYANDGKQHLLLAASGSVATIKIANMLESLSRHENLSICVIFTKSAANFLAGQSAEQPRIESFRKYTHVEGVFFDEDEWEHPWKRGNPILHIELRRWASILVVAPLSANTLAKIAGGFSDNLLTSVVRAWDTTGEIEGTVQGARGRRKRILVAAAMNTAMWRHPVTRRHIAVLEDDWGVPTNGEDAQEGGGWFEVLRPHEKELACGDVGDGAMKDWREIVEVIEERLQLNS